MRRHTEAIETQQLLIRVVQRVTVDVDANPLFFAAMKRPLLKPEGHRADRNELFEPASFPTHLHMHYLLGHCVAPHLRLLHLVPFPANQEWSAHTKTPVSIITTGLYPLDVWSIKTPVKDGKTHIIPA